MTPAAGAPSRPLVLLALAVLGAHLLVLRATPPAVSWVASPASARTTAPVVHVLMAPAEVTATPAAGPVTPIAKPVVRSPAREHREAVTAPVPAPVIVSALAAPASARWRYTALALHRGVLLEGAGSLDWSSAGGSYDAALSIQVPGLPAREQRSTGDVADGEGLRPRRFSDRVRSEQATHFDRAGGQVVFSSNQPAVALEAGAQDRVSVLVQLLALARAEPGRLAPGTSITVQVAGARAADAWTFAVERWEALDLPGGAVRALKLTRPPAREYDLRMEIWIAPDYGPVRLRLTPPNGDWLDLQWSGTDKG